uniref:virulence factor TspB C-terminal domain-related protein n=1 Tax=Umezakia ovalisporum TaxID=75695 RepID=UPI0039C65557
PTHTTTLDNVSGNTTVVESIPTHHFEYGSQPLSVTSHTTTITNTYVNGQQTSSTTTSNQTENPVTSPVATETPTDCAFMPTVCAFIEWVKTPFNEQAPELGDFIENEDFEREFNMPGNATCPAPMIISTSKGGYEFSWDPACQWAGLIKPFIIIGALILAIMINLGSFRRD